MTGGRAESPGWWLKQHRAACRLLRLEMTKGKSKIRKANICSPPEQRLLCRLIWTEVI